MLADQLSFWEQEAFFSDIQVAVIGSGIVGLNAALELKTRQPALGVAVLERGFLPAGASTRNAGFACFGSVTELLDDLQDRPATEVWDLVERRYRGLLRLREKLGDAALRYEPLGGYELFRPLEAATYATCLEALPDFNQEMARITGDPATYVEASHRLTELPFRGVDHLLLNRLEGQLDTGQMMRTLLAKAQAAGVRVLNGVDLAQVLPTSGGVQVLTRNGWELFFEKVLICTNGFAQELWPELPVRPGRNQVLITAPLPQLPLAGAFHYDRGYFYFRNVGQRLLLGGGRNLDVAGETTTALGPHPEIRQALLDLLHAVILPDYPVAVERWWTGILGLGAEKTPIIAPVAPNVFAAVRMGGMGVAIGTLVGEEAAQLLLNS